MYTAAFLSTLQYLYMGTYGINLAVHCPLAEWAGAIPYVNSETVSDSNFRFRPVFLAASRWSKLKPVFPEWKANPQFAIL